MIPTYMKPRAVLVAALSLAALQPVQAQLFGDNEARRAILDLRERYQSMQQEMGGMRSSVQQMQGQMADTGYFGDILGAGAKIGAAVI